jgi:NAD(P)-dependent dehydrogenase (short-subunit alcohol dehydrogenase family)
MPQDWLITGTSSGFGRILTELALERGDNVVVAMAKPSALDGLKEGTAATQVGLGSECTGIMRVLGPNGFLSPGRYDIG